MTTSNETSDYFKMMEKRLMELEKKNETQEKTICKLRIKNEEMKEKLEEQHIQQHMDISDSEEMERRDKMSVLSVECILSYMDPNKRIQLSFHYPQFERIEKRLPLKLSNLLISIIIEIDDTVYRCVNEERICSMKRSGPFDIVESVNSKKCFPAIIRMAFRFFSGRKNIQVDRFTNYNKIPFNLDIHAELIETNGYSSIENYEGLVQSVGCVKIRYIETLQDVTHPLIRNAKKLNLPDGRCQNFLLALPNLQNETVQVELWNETFLLVPLIMKYRENRNRRIGSKLILTVEPNLRNYALNAVFDSGELVNYGFQWIFRDVLRYPIENNPEIRIRVGESSSEAFSIHLDVVPST